MTKHNTLPRRGMYCKTRPRGNLHPEVSVVIVTLTFTLININEDKNINIRLYPMKMKQECAFCFDLDPLKCTSLPLTHISFEKCINRAATLLKIVELETLQPNG